MIARIMILSAGLLTLLAATEDRLPASGKPEGQRILFASNRGGMKNLVGIYAMSSDGSRQTRLSPEDALFEFDPALSPDGKRIAFAALNRAAKEDYATAIFVRKVAGGGQKQLTDKKELVCAPRWSPDGALIAFCEFTIFTGDTGVYVVGADGGNRRKVADGVFPVWSPDGKKLLFVSIDDPKQPRLSVIDVAGGKAERLGDQDVFMADWSPDGKRIVCMSHKMKNSALQTDLFIMSSDGTARQQLTETPELEFGPRWSPDGRRIFFSRVPSAGEEFPRSGEEAELFVVDAEGGKETRITDNKAFDSLGVGPFVFLMSHPKK